MSAFPAWNGASTSPDIRGETQNASAQERAAAATTKQVDLMVPFFAVGRNMIRRKTSDFRF